MERTGYRVRSQSFILCACSLLLLAVLWIVFVGGIRIDETITGAGALLLSLAFLYQVWRTEDLELDFHLADLAQGWRIPWYVVTGICEIILIFLKDLFRVRRARSFYRVSGFMHSGKDPHLIARRVLAIFYTTMAPNFIVIGVDDRQDRMLFHQLERSSIPLMTQALGAKQGGRQL